MTRLEEEDIKKVASLDYDWSRFTDKTILLSGGTGFIGQFFIEVIKYRNRIYGDRISVVSCSRHPLADEEGVQYVCHDIAQELEYGGAADYILHLASNTHPKQYAADPVGTITTAVFGTYHLLRLAAEKHATRFLLASSVEIYGEGSAVPFKEADCGYLDCKTARAGYNEAKRVSESLCQSFVQQYGVDCTIARFSRVFGADKKNDSKAIAQFLSCALRGEDVVLKSKGNQRYSYCYVADAVSAMIKILLDGKTGEAYNISEADEGLSLGEYAAQIAALNGKGVVYDIVADPSVSKASYALLDCAKLSSLGWKPLYSVSEALKRTYNILSMRK